MSTAKDATLAAIEDATLATHCDFIEGGFMPAQEIVQRIARRLRELLPYAPRPAHAPRVTTGWRVADLVGLFPVETAIAIVVREENDKRKAAALPKGKRMSRPVTARAVKAAYERFLKEQE